MDKHMKSHEDRSYWERACHFFRSAGLADTEGSYLVHNNNAETVRIGLQTQVSVSVGIERIASTVDGVDAVEVRAPGEPIFKRVQRLLRHDAPYFFLASPDVDRQFVDPSLPLVRFVQPAVELTFSPAVPAGEVTYAQRSDGTKLGHDLLRGAAGSRSTCLPARPGPMRSFAQLVSGWSSDEDDESFTARLAHAIDVLQDHPDGKMTLTRAYARRTASTRSPFDLYYLHSRANGAYACSHYFCLSPGVVSVGTTPENVLEIDGRTLTVDVVAATCRVGDDEYVARELLGKPKQVREHRLSLVNRQNRFRPFCEDGSIRVVQDMRVKRLRNVCHLHSIFTGRLVPQATIFDLLGNLFPLLGARPAELLAQADAEPGPHRYYGGVVGHMYRGTGGCFLNIRNALLDSQVIHAKVGVGVLAESESRSELVETRDKLSGLLEAVHLWEQPKPHAGNAGATDERS